MNDIENLRDMMIALLANKSAVTKEFIRESVNGFSVPFGEGITALDKDNLVKYLESQFDVTMNIGSIIQEKFTPWLEAEKSSIEPFYWDRYKKLLQQKGFGLNIIPKIDQVTDKTLGLLENPMKTGAWERKGMVVGHVQSGKTANYTGLICKAADSGYRLIIVIAGIHNNLRSQTQARIDEGFVGKDSSRLLRQEPDINKFIGVGRFDHSKIPITLTNTTEDFSKNTAEMLGLGLDTVKVPIVLVIKKNYRTLENLIAWLKEHNAVRMGSIEDHPMLMIDDEADNASINTSPNPDEATKINSLLRKTLNLFHKRCYVGYTATPFANIFIDPDSDDEMLHGDLFPRDFIVSLDPPTNYMGADRIFDENGDLNAVRNITDYENILPIRHKIGHTLTELPPSMYQAMCTFILVIALRILRGQSNKHNSMLINASRFTNIQSKIRNILHEFMQDTERQIRFNYKKSVSEALENYRMRNIYEIWEKEFDGDEFSWTQVQAVLLEAAAPIKIIEINSGSSDVLDYESYKKNGLNVVAVGGFSLSRGLTLEGLSISYFLRNSIMYDTLMQMGRWFGFRPGYEDLCRIFMPRLAAGWYAHISGVIEELKTEFREMELASMTPKDFGLKIRSHPDSLIVTARNKMRTGEIVYRNIDLNEKLIETDKLCKAFSDISHNRSMLENLVRKLCELKDYEITELKNYLWKNIPIELVTEFIQGFRNHQASIRTSTDPVLEHINRRKNDELIFWDVVIINKGSAKDDEKEQLCGLSVGCEKRSSGLKSEELSNCIIVGDKARVGSTSDEKEGLDDNELQNAEKRYLETPLDKKPKKITGLYYRKVRSRPLLIIHLLNIVREPNREVTHKGVVAYGISFPKSNYPASPVKYVVNTTWWKSEYGYDLEGDDDE
jgi:hypothetical protein